MHSSEFIALTLRSGSGASRSTGVRRQRTKSTILQLNANTAAIRAFGRVTAHLTARRGLSGRQ